MRIKSKLAITLSIISIILTVYSCQKENEEPDLEPACCETVDLIGQWNMTSYWHELPNGERGLYAQNNMQAITENLFPDLISGQITFNEDKTFSENFKFVIVRDSTQTDTIETSLNGTYIDDIEEGSCNFSFDRGNITFQAQSEEIFSSVSRNCTPGFDFPIIYNKRVNQDSISFYIWKQ